MTKISILGAGIAGLTCAHYLKQAGHEVTLIDKADAPGGRMRTDVHEGFLLDRGFQIFLPAYPEAKAILDYDALDLRHFRNGALIHLAGKTLPMFDPVDGLWDGIKSLIQGPLIFGDGMKMLGLKSRVSQATVPSLYEGDSMSTAAYLQYLRLSEKNIEGFWKPFYQGIFLENDLSTDKRLFEFTLKMFSEDGAAVPAKGMQRIPEQLAVKLGPEALRLETEIHRLTEQGLETVSGTLIESDIVVDACGLTEKSSTAWKMVTNLYLRAKSLPKQADVIHLNAKKKRIVNNVAFMSHVAPAYAQDAEGDLISVSANGEQSETDMKREVVEMFGPAARGWETVTKYIIREALPERDIRYDFEPKVKEGLYRCGDIHLEGSINGAMRSGRLAAEAILEA